MIATAASAPMIPPITPALFEVLDCIKNIVKN